MNNIERVEAYARKAHTGQKRKYRDEDYIEHPIRVMQICRSYTDDESVLQAALLHDVIEDTPVSISELNEFLIELDPVTAARVLRLVLELTDGYTSDKYPSWNREKRKKLETIRLSGISPKAQTIKYADIIDNCTDIVTTGSDFAPRYLREAEDILHHTPRGNQELYRKALDTVYECQQQLRVVRSGRLRRSAG